VAGTPVVTCSSHVLRVKLTEDSEMHDTKASTLIGVMCLLSYLLSVYRDVNTVERKVSSPIDQQATSQLTRLASSNGSL